MKLASKLRYLLFSALHIYEKGICPYCKASDYKSIKRKYLVTRLVCCRNCNLLFRLPNDKIGFNESFYQDTYIQNDNITTHLPSDQELEALVQKGFQGTGKDILELMSIFHVLFGDVKDIKLLDFGASWGYMTYSFAKEGFDTQGFEISAKRAQFGRDKLGVDLLSDKHLLRTNNQIFFSSHVIEHVPSIKDMVQDAFRLTQDSPHAYFIALCPNGSNARLAYNSSEYHANWGLVHPNFISADFYQHVFSNYPYYIGTNPHVLKTISGWDKSTQIIDNLQGGELMIIVKLK